MALSRASILVQLITTGLIQAIKLVKHVTYLVKGA